MRYRTTLSAALGTFAFTLGFPSAAAATTVVAQWDMGDTFGNTMADSSGNGNNGTTYNIVTSGTGYVFNGSNSKIIVPDSPTLDFGTADFTYTVQLQFDVRPPKARDYDLIRKGLSPTIGGEFKMEIVYGLGLAKPQCNVKDGAGHEAALRGTQDLADGQLHTITCKKTATGLTMQVDGGRIRKKSVALGSISNDAPLTIGVKDPNSPEGNLRLGDWYNGFMESVTISVEP